MYEEYNAVQFQSEQRVWTRLYVLQQKAVQVQN